MGKLSVAHGRDLVSATINAARKSESGRTVVRCLASGAIGVYVSLVIVAVDTKNVWLGVGVLGPLILALLVRRIQKLLAARAAMIEAARERNQIHLPQRVASRLLRDERVEWMGRKHGVCVLRWWLLLFATPLGIVAGLFLDLVLMGLASSVLAAILAIWHILMDWRLEWLVVTDTRGLIIRGIFGTKVPAVKRAELDSVHEQEPFFSKVLGFFGFRRYIRIHVDTPVQNDAFNLLNHVGDREVFELLNSRGGGEP